MIENLLEDEDLHNIRAYEWAKNSEACESLIKPENSVEFNKGCAACAKLIRGGNNG